MQLTSKLKLTGNIRRLAYATAAAALLVLLIESLTHSGGGWQAAAFGLGPDAALLIGSGAGLERGQLHPRAVPAYNVLHRVWGPVALALLVAAGVLPSNYLAGAAAWGLHVALDRALGYGLRTPEGFQRG